MKVFLAAATPIARAETPIPAFEKLAIQDRFCAHELTDDADAADIILFVDCHQHEERQVRSLRTHPLAVKYPRKTLVYNERDLPWCVLPGIYVSMPACSFDAQRQKAYGYYTTGHHFDKVLEANPDLLFSFVGAKSHKIRTRVLRLCYARAIVEESIADFFDSSGSAQSLEKQSRQKIRFVHLIERSKFVLCPRGVGTSSIRLFEVMAAGRVPVIISDAWVPPVGPKWEDFSIRVLESQIETIPALLESYEARYNEMAQRARQAYEEWFAPDVMFHHLIENCGELLRQDRAFEKTKPLLDRQYWMSVVRVILRASKKHIRQLVRRGSKMRKMSGSQ